MLPHELLEDDGLLIITPVAPLTSEDFKELAKEVDSYIQRNGKLAAVVVEAHSFPGWQDFGGFLSHLQFVHDHHKQIKRVAIISDSKVLAIAPLLVGHFVAAEIKHFPEDQRQAALDWARAG